MRIHEMMVQKVAANVRAQREKLGLSQNDLARMTGASQGYISLLETGARQPSLTMVGQLAEALGVSVEEIFK